MINKNIYLDNHSSTQIDKRVYKKMIAFLTNIFGNPHSHTHSHGWATSKFIDLSRLQIAKIIKAKKEEIFFTSGATESNNLVLKGLAFSQKKKCGKIINCCNKIYIFHACLTSFLKQIT